MESMECFWIPVKGCPYLENRQSYLPDKAKTPELVVDKKDNPMLRNFTVEEVCKNCLIATYIQLRGRV